METEEKDKEEKIKMMEKVVENKVFKKGTHVWLHSFTKATTLL